MGYLDHLWFGVLSVFQASPAFSLFGLPISVTLLMIAGGFVLGILAGATPGLAGPMVMAIALPILISVFGVGSNAFLPVLGFLIGVMKGATIGGAVPAILFNTPGTPDAVLTTYDGYPMAKQGQAGKALRMAHFASASGDTVSDLILVTTAPFLALWIERFLDLPEKTGLYILALSFVVAVAGRAPGKAMISAGLGLLIAFVGTGEDFYPRLSLGQDTLSDGFPVAAVVLGVLILGEVLAAMERLLRTGPEKHEAAAAKQAGQVRLTWRDLRACWPYIRSSSVIGTMIGALPGIGSTLAATLGYAVGRRRWRRRHPSVPGFGTGRLEGIAATEAANSAVSGANLLPVLSLGIPGNTAAVFLILAMESIDGLNPGPAVFKLEAGGGGHALNPELVMVFGLFTAMMIANLLNWTLGGVFMHLAGGLARIPKHLLLPVVLLLTLTGIYVQFARMSAIYFALGFGVLGYVMRRLRMSVLPFIIAFILGRPLEQTGRQAFAATGGDGLFLLHSPLALAFVLLALLVIGVATWSAVFASNPD